MIYNFNLGIGWASSGVEYAQLYRSKVFNDLNISSKFIFTDLILHENITHFTQNIGFKTEDVVWLYQSFTDVKSSSTTFTIEQVIEMLDSPVVNQERGEQWIKLVHGQENTYVKCYLTAGSDTYVQRAEFVSKGKLIRKDYYSYVPYLREYYRPFDNKATVTTRHWLNENQSVAYEEIVRDENQSVFIFPDKICYNKSELIAYFMKRLKPTADDLIIIDRSTDIGQPILEHKSEAKVVIVVHAEHFNVGMTDEDNILWNNYYDYQFTNANEIDGIICSTDVQSNLLREQFLKYHNIEPFIITIPVGSLSNLKYPSIEREPYSLITASRLASEKHLDWVIKAVIEAKKIIPQLKLDIYGKGDKEGSLIELILNNNAQDYIQLKGHVDLTDIYQNYEAYISGSTSEGFGLTLLEAIGSGLPMIGFDVRYGNQNFIEHGKNGYLLDWDTDMKESELISGLVEAILRLYEQDLNKFSEYSYHVAKNYLNSEVYSRWQELLEELNID